MKKAIITILLALSLTAVLASAAQAQVWPHSTTGPVPPANVKAPDPNDVSRAQATISGVPAYLWRHGCGPTAVGMVVGYYDGQGYDNLVSGSAATQTTAAQQMMASGGDSSSPYPSGSERHYEDYSRPEDTSTVIPDNYITASRTPHTDDCLADFMHTSRSTDSMLYGWSSGAYVEPSYENYVSFASSVYTGDSTVYFWTGSPTLTWAILTNEIDNNRPMVFLVDSDGNGSTDHFVTIVGYRDDAGNGQEYACYDTWYTTVRWCPFAAMSSSYQWGIYAGWSFDISSSVTADFSSSTYSVAENGGSVSISVNLNQAPGTGNSASVDYATSNDTASSSSDYTAASGTLNFGATDTTQSFSITINDDHSLENDETVTITLSNPVGCTLTGTNNPATLTITNDELDPDGDLISTWDEEHGTHGYVTRADLWDSDSDGWSDYQEMITYGTNPNDINDYPTGLSSLRVPFFGK